VLLIIAVNWPGLADVAVVVVVVVEDIWRVEIQQTVQRQQRLLL